MLTDIRKHYNEATFCAKVNGMTWYQRAYQVAWEMHLETGIRADRCAAIISHLSPMRTWEENVVKAWEFVRTGDTCAFGAQLAGCRRAMEMGDPLNSFGKAAHKTRNFYLSIMGDPTAVCLDRWAVRAAGLDLDTWNSGSAARYAAVAEEYKIVAEEVGVLPYQLQAIVWCQIRKSAH